MARLNPKKVWKLVKRKEKGLPSRLIGKQLGISKRRVNQVWAEFLNTDTFKLKKPGTPKSRVLTQKEKTTILKLYEHQKMGARVIGIMLRRRYNAKIGNNLIHEFLLKNNMAETNENKQRRRRPWVRYERKHSLSAGHMDWHTSAWKDELQVCTVIDDSSRKILAAVECENATEKESIKLVQEVIDKYGHIRVIEQIITDHGVQFYNNKPNKEGDLTKNDFQKFLEEKGIKHIPCRYKHPQTNGKQEKWFDTYERHRKKFGSLGEFVKWYNETRIHESLGYRTPEKVFWERLEPFVWTVTGKFFKEVEQ